MADLNILMVEDDPEFAQFVVTYLGKNGFKVTSVGTGADLFKVIDDDHYDCLVVDLTLPDEDGIVLVRKVRARSAVPIVVLTGREGVDDKLACFEVGADDYVTKPVDPRELIARIQAVLRRAQDITGPSRDDVLVMGSVKLDRLRRVASREDGGEIDFTPAEFSLVWVLAQADGKVQSRDDLVDAVSTGDGPINFRAVDILVSRVRKKLGDKSALLTVPHVGYKCGWPVQGVGVEI